MPRNNSGLYSLPIPTFTAGTLIKSADVTSNFADIATALTGSMATDGTSTITGSVEFFAGTLASPGVSFASSPGTGFYLSAADTIQVVNNGAVSATFATGGVVTWVGAQTMQSTLAVAGAVTASAAMTIGTNLSLGAASATAKFDFKTSAMIRQQCQLTLSGGSLLLSPYQGNLMFISDQNYVIPSAGVTLSAAGVSAATFYYIYVYMSGTTMTLEFSITAPTTSTTYGVKVKTADATRTLVGAAYTTAGSAWIDQAGSQQVLSYYNRRTKTGYVTQAAAAAPGNGTYPGTVYTEVSTSLRNSFITWSDEEVNLSGFATTAITGAAIVGVGVDGLTSLGSGATSTNQFGVGFAASTSGLTEAALHYGTLLNSSNAAINYQGTTAVNGAASRVGVTIKG